MANISSQFKRASELYQRAVQQYQVKQKEQRALIDQFKVGDQNTKVKLKPQLIALHQEMQHHQELVDRAEAAFEKALAGEPVNLGEDTIVKNKKTGNVYSVKKANPAIHTKPSASDIAQAKADNGGDVKAEPKADGMATVNGIASTTGLRAQAVAGWADENGVNLSKVADDLKSKKLKPMDFMTAVVGNPGNKYAKDIIAKYSQKAEPTSNLSPKKIKSDLEDIKGTTGEKLMNLLIKGEKDPQSALGLKDSQYDNLLKRLAKIGGESEHESKFRTNNYSTNDLENWAKERVNKVSNNSTKGPELDVDKQSHIKDIPQKFRSMVSMKIDQLAKAAAEAKAAGEKAPNFNLCDITIPGTNLYCKGNKGIPREDMPQFKGYAKPGSIADKLPKNNDGEVDTESQFKVLLKRNGVAVSEPQEVPADQLKATQTELVGAKVAGMTKALETEPNHPKITAPIYVSNDGYVLDGHHRWAAVTSSAVASGKPAMMNVRVIDMPIKDLVKISNDFADQIGIQQKKADANAEAPKKEVTEVTTNDWHFKKILQMWDKANSFGKKKIGTVLCRNPRASRNDIIAAMRDSDYKEITHFTDKLHIESVITEKQLKGLEGISTNTSLEKISKDQKLKIIKAPGNIIDFIVPKGETRNFWQVMGTGKIKKNTDGEYYLEGKVINSPMFKSIDELVKGVLWKSMEERRRFNEGVIKEDTDTSNIIKDLDKVRHDLIKKVDVLISKKKKLYANVDITTPMSADEKQLDKDIQSIFSQIQDLIQQKRKIKTESVNEQIEIVLSENLDEGLLQNAILAAMIMISAVGGRHYVNHSMERQLKAGNAVELSMGQQIFNGNKLNKDTYVLTVNPKQTQAIKIDTSKSTITLNTSDISNSKIKSAVRDQMKKIDPSLDNQKIDKGSKDAAGKIKFGYHTGVSIGQGADGNYGLRGPGHFGLGYDIGESVNEDMDTTADESGMFISSITSAMESAQGIQQTIQAKGENFDVPAWVQAKTALASDYLHSINRYYKGNPDQD